MLVFTSHWIYYILAGSTVWNKTLTYVNIIIFFPHDLSVLLPFPFRKKNKNELHFIFAV